MSDRRRRFRDRIESEREILQIVNSAGIGQSMPLAGMTGEAITDWQDRASAALDGPLVIKIVDLLLELGRRAELIADNSRDVFDGSELSIDDRGIESTKQRLAELIRDIEICQR